MTSDLGLLAKSANARKMLSGFTVLGRGTGAWAVTEAL